MKELRYTLITDGSSDSLLMEIIKWLLDDLYPKQPNKGQYADFRKLPNPPKAGDFVGKVKFAKNYYPFDLLFVHRDAENSSFDTIEQREGEIKKSLADDDIDKIICIIPIRMMETWLLFNADAIKKAAGNRNFSEPIILPKLKYLENEPQAKQKLHDILKQASGLKGRQLKKFNVDRAVHLVAENIDNFNDLRGLSAFSAFESKLKKVIDGWLFNNLRV